jgi:hypothetical protein
MAHRGGGLKRFVARHERLLTAFGAMLVLITFLVREGFREHVRDLAQDIEVGENAYAMKMEFLALRNEIHSLQTSFDFELKERRGDEVNKRNIARASGLYQTAMELDGNVANLKDLIRHFPRHWRLQYSEELESARKAVDSAAREDRGAQDEGLPPVDTELERRMRVQFEMQRQLNVYANVQRFLQFQYVLLLHAQMTKEEEDKYYTWCNAASYVTYVLGWLLAFIGRVLGVSRLAEGATG